MEVLKARRAVVGVAVGRGAVPVGPVERDAAGIVRRRCGSRGERDEDPENRDALVALLSATSGTGGAEEPAAARADALHRDVREILAGDFLDLAVGVAEANQFSEGERLAGRREAIETIALTTDNQTLQAEHGILGRTDGRRLGLGSAHRKLTKRIYQSGKSLRQADIRLTYQYNQPAPLKKHDTFRL